MFSSLQIRCVFCDTRKLTLENFLIESEIDILSCKQKDALMLNSCQRWALTECFLFLTTVNYLMNLIAY